MKDVTTGQHLLSKNLRHVSRQATDAAKSAKSTGTRGRIGLGG